MRKRLSAALLALCMALSLLPAGALAADGSAGYRIDYKKETITAEEGWALSRDEGFEETLLAGAAVTPGETLYLREGDGGEVRTIDIPKRPDAPATPLKVEKQYTKSTLRITVINNSEYVSCEYSWDGKTWASTFAKNTRTRNTDLEIQVRYQATADAFASESLSRRVTTPDWDGATTLKDGEQFNNTSEKVIIANDGGTVTVAVAGSLEITIQLPEPGDIEVNGDSFVKVPAGSIVRVGENSSVTLDAAGTINPITGHITPEPEEQFPALTPGGTYWFDLSGANIPGAVNCADNSMKNIPGIPDETLHYVPFTYAGTIDAYVLKSHSENPDGNDSKTAANSTDTHDPIGCHYPHSLFIADYNVTNYVSWNTLGQENLIFGKDYLFGGVSYTLRAPSQGNERPSGTPLYEATPNRPSNNEWDTILNQAENDIYNNTSGYIKNWLGYESWGQDWFSNYSLRGYYTARELSTNPPDDADENYWESGFRPVLEVQANVPAEGLKPVTLSLNGGTLTVTTVKAVPGEDGAQADGDFIETALTELNLVAPADGAYPAPSGDGLTPPEGRSFFSWLGSDGNLYLPGRDVPARVDKLKAQWELALTVEKADGASLDPSGTAAYGDTVRLTAAVPTTEPAEGEITFYLDSEVLGAAELTDNRAVLPLALSGETWEKGFAIGENTITARFGGSADVNAATGSAKLTVEKTPASPAPAVEGTTVTNDAVTLPHNAAWEYSADGKAWGDTYTFTGLDADTDYTYYVREKGTDTAQPSKAAAVPVRTAPDRCTVTFDSRGGSAVADAVVAYGEKADKPADPARSGFRFDGWYREADCVTVWDFASPVTAHLTLYAKWTANSGGASNSGGSHTPSRPAVDANKTQTDETDVAAMERFTDVSRGDWCYDGVKYVYEKGLMAGTSDTTFGPEIATTRGMVVTILYRLEGSPQASGEGGAFPDIPAGRYYTDAVAWGAANGIVRGCDDGRFAPDDPITREQLAAILYRYASHKGYDTAKQADLTGFADMNQISGYALEPLAWANAEGLVNGTGESMMSPRGQATRAQVTVILMRFCENIVK